MTIEAPPSVGVTSFELIGDDEYPAELSQRLAGVPSQGVGTIVEDLRRIAAGKSPYKTPALRGRGVTGRS